MPRFYNNYIKYIFFALIFIMILMRLVWMQQRVYPVEWSGRDAMVSLAAVGMQSAECSLDPKVLPWTLSDTTIKSQDIFKEWYRWLGTPFKRLLMLTSCDRGAFNPRKMQKLSQWIWVTSVWIIAALVRMLSGRWGISLVVAAILMSRGSLMDVNGRMDASVLYMIVICSWVTSSIHFMKSGSSISYIVSWLVAIAGFFVDGALAALFLVHPIFLILGRVLGPKAAIEWGVVSEPKHTSLEKGRLNPKEQTSTILRNSILGFWGDVVGFGIGAGRRLGPSGQGSGKGIFNSINSPYSHWAFARRRAKQIILSGIVGFALFGGYVAFQIMRISAEANSFGAHTLGDLGLRDLGGNAALSFYQQLDFHLLISLGLVCFSAIFLRSKIVYSYFEAVWLVLIAAAGVFICSFCLDYFEVGIAAKTGLSLGKDATDFVAPRLSSFWIWFEPIFIALGMLAGLTILHEFFDRYLAGNVTK